LARGLGEIRSLLRRHGAVDAHRHRAPWLIPAEKRNVRSDLAQPVRLADGRLGASATGSRRRSQWCFVASDQPVDGDTSNLRDASKVEGGERADPAERLGQLGVVEADLGRKGALAQPRRTDQLSDSIDGRTHTGDHSNEIAFIAIWWGWPPSWPRLAAAGGGV